MQRLVSITLLILLSASLAGCGGQSSSSLPRLSTATSARLTITIPRAATTASERRVLYISPATQALAVTISGGPTALSEGINLSTSNPNCLASASSLVCTLSLALAACPNSSACYTGTFVTYDAAYTGTSNGMCTPLSSCVQPAAKILSQSQSVPFAVVASEANNLPIVFGGVPASLRIVSDSTDITGDQVATFSLPAKQSGQMSVIGVDADGNFILGPGAPAVSLTASSSTPFTVATPSASAPNLFTVTDTSSVPAAGELTATVTPAAGSATSALVTNVRIFSQPPTLFISDASIYALQYSTQGAEQMSITANLNGPFGVAYDSANGLLYVVNLYTPSVTAYNLQGVQQTLTGSFPNLNFPQGIVFDPATGYLYVANEGSNRVTAYDGEGNQQTLAGNFANLNAPGWATYDSANGFIYVTNLGNSTVTAYDGQGNQQRLSGTFPNLGYEAGIAYDPDNNFLYVANGHTVSTFNAEGVPQKLSGSFPNSYAVDIAYDPANGALWVTNQGPIPNEYTNEGVQMPGTGQFPNVRQSFGITVIP